MYLELFAGCSVLFFILLVIVYNSREKIISEKRLLRENYSELIASKSELIDRYEANLKELSELKAKQSDDVTLQTIENLANDLKIHGFNLIRINPDNVFLRN